MPSIRPNIFESTDALSGTNSYLRLGVGQTGQGTLSSPSDHDWWGVSLVAGQSYTFALIGTGTNRVSNTFLTLRDSYGNTIVSDDDSGPANSSLLKFTAQSTGTYYLDAGSYGNYGSGQYGISATSGSQANFDYYMGAGALDTGLQWTGTRGTSAVVTYGFRQTSATYTVPGHDTSTFSQLSSQEMSAVRQILNAWSEVSGVVFQEVNPNGYTDSATMLFGNYLDRSDGAGAFAYYPGSTAPSSPAGDVWLNLGSVSTSSIPMGGYSYFAIMHEVGHALGLSHPGDYNAAPGQTITYQNSAQFIQDSEQYTLMSYFGGAATGQNPGGFAVGYTPGVLDVLEIQQLYGSNYNTRSGDTIYGVGATAGSAYTFAAPDGGTPRFTIWDGGGKDTIDASIYNQNQNIDLREGAFSDIGSGKQNIAIALNVTIESAIGGSGSDSFIGNAAANTFVGNGGSNIYAGGFGDDSYVVSSATDRITEYSGQGFDTVYANNVDFNLSNNTSGIERLVVLSSDHIGSGTDASDTLIAYGARDILLGGGGNDTLYSNGNDIVSYGSVGDDVYVVTSPTDIVREASNEGFDIIYANDTDYSLDISSTNVEVLVLLSSNHVGAGRDNADDVITSYGNNDALYGGGGNDALSSFGSGGSMDGGFGSDTYVLVSRSTIIYEHGGDADTVYADGVDFSLADAPGVENLVLRGNNHVGAGTEGVDLIISAGISNALFGGGGDDIFSFTPAHGASQILDFDMRPGEHDRVAFSKSQFADFSNLQSHLFQSGADALIVINDGSNDTLLIKNTIATNLSSSDFLFV